MTKQQKMCAVAGGAFGLCVLALGWFLYSAYAEHQEILEGGEETSEGLTAAKAKYADFHQKDPFPSTETIKLVKANEAVYVKWRTNALEVASNGDLPPAPSSQDSGDLKIMMSDQVARMQKLPGINKAGINKANICAHEFQFGFEPYLSSDKKNEKAMPTDPKELSALYAQFVTITNVVNLLHSNGVLEIRKIERVKLQDDNPDAAASNQRKKGKGGKGKSAKDAAVVDAPTRYDFGLEYVVRASAFVNVLNAFVKSPRFYVVGDFSFEHEGESLKERLNRTRNPSASGGEATGRRGRGMWGNAPEKQEEKTEKEVGLVTRPDKDSPIVVKMKLSVYDFGKGGSRAGAAEKEDN